MSVVSSDISCCVPFSSADVPVWLGVKILLDVDINLKLPDFWLMLSCCSAAAVFIPVTNL